MEFLLHSFIHIVTLQAIPQAGSGGGNVTCDGRIQRGGVTESFATIRAGAGTAASKADATISVFLFSASSTNNYNTLTRGGLSFDTQSVPPSANILSVTLYLHGHSKLNSLGSPDLCICTFTPNNPADYVAGDYALSRWGSELASVTYSAWNTSGYNIISLPTTSINAGGITSYGLRLSWDQRNTTSGLNWVASAVSGIYLYAADNGSLQPYLVVEYM